MMQYFCIDPPAFRDIPNRQVVLEPESQQLDPPAGSFAGSPSLLLLSPGCFTEDRLGPSAVEEAREARLSIRYMVEIAFAGRLFFAGSCSFCLKTQGHVACGTIQKCPESGRPVPLGMGQ